MTLLWHKIPRVLPLIYFVGIRFSVGSEEPLRSQQNRLPHRPVIFWGSFLRDRGSWAWSLYLTTGSVRILGSFIFRYCFTTCNLGITNTPHEQNPTWGAHNMSPCQEIFHILWNPKVYYHVQKCPPHVPVLYQIYPVHALPTNFFEIHSIVILPSTPMSSNWSVSQFSLPKPNMCFSPYVPHAPFLSWFLIDHPNNTWWEAKSWIS